MIYRRCPGCRSWYDKKLGDCPECGEAKAGNNKFLHTAKLNAHLYGMAEGAVSQSKHEASLVKKAKAEREP